MWVELFDVRKIELFVDLEPFSNFMTSKVFFFCLSKSKIGNAEKKVKDLFRV